MAMGARKHSCDVIKTANPRILSAIAERYVETDSGGHIWSGAVSRGKNGKPYGIVIWRVGSPKRRKKLYVHRLIASQHLGCDYDELRGYDVHHTCGNSLCINVDHLRRVPSDAHGRAHRFAELAEEERYRLDILGTEATYAV